jgi:outer membrane lipoprotein-sorting protein
MKKLSSDESGLSHVVLVILIVGVVAAIGIVGWRVMNKNKTDNSSGTVVVKTDKAEAQCNHVYHDKNLCKFASSGANFEKLSYVAVDTAKDTSGQTSTINIQSDGKGNSSVASAGGGASFASVSIGSTVYIKDNANNVWIKYPPTQASASQNPTKDIKADFSDSSTPADKQIKYKSLGKEKCGNLTCYKYQVIDPSSPNVTQYVWFDTKDYRLQRWSSSGADGSNDFVITYKSVKVNTPSPVQAAPSASGMTQQQIQQLQQQYGQ